MIRLNGRAVETFPEENIPDGRLVESRLPRVVSLKRRFQTWCRDEVLRRVLTDVANELRDRGGGAEVGTRYPVQTILR
jgi:hypothetical protein